MIGSMWVLWMVFVFVFLLAPMTYGWGYRGWGPPYPSAIQRRRAERASAAGVGSFDHRSWGLGGDFLWAILFVGGVWAVMAFAWR